MIELIWIFVTLAVVSIGAILGKKYGIEFIIVIIAASTIMANVFASKIITFFGLATAIYCAVIINFILAALIFLAKYFPVDQPEEERKDTFGLHHNQNDIFGMDSTNHLRHQIKKTD